MKTRRVFVAVLAVVAAVALAQSSMRNEAAARTPSGPRAVHRESRASQLPVKNYGLGIAYYSVRGGLRTSLTLNNKGPAALFPAVTLYARDGRRHRMDGLTVNGRSFLELDLRDLTAAAGPGFEDGSLRVAYSGRALELGGMLTMTDLETGVEWYDQLMYEAAARSNRLEGVWWLPNEATEARLVVTNGSTDPVDVRVTFNGTTPAPRSRSAWVRGSSRCWTSASRPSRAAGHGTAGWGVSQLSTRAPLVACSPEGSSAIRTLDTHPSSRWMTRPWPRRHDITRVGSGWCRWAVRRWNRSSWPATSARLEPP